jgi:hypothetical protein
MKKGIPVFIEQLHSAFPLFHEKVFGSFSTAHPKIDVKKNVMVSWISNAALQRGGEGIRVLVLNDVFSTKSLLYRLTLDFPLNLLPECRHRASRQQSLSEDL